MNRKGQALVEFVIILPVFLMILFAIVDFGTIFSRRNRLESISGDIVDMYKNGDSVSNIKSNYKDVKIDINGYQDKYVKISIRDDVKVMTPGLDRIIGSPYKIVIERVINEVK